MDFKSAAHLIKKSKIIGITLYEKAGGDEMGSALALAAILEKQRKQVGFLYCGAVEKKWKEIFDITNEFDAQPHLIRTPVPPQDGETRPQDLVIAINTNGAPINEIKYETQGDSGELFIRIIPKGRPIAKERIRIFEDKTRYDCIVSIGIHGPEHFGKEFEENPFLFYETPIINIDAAHQNEQFGEINLCDMTKSSCAEITYELIESLTEDRLGPTESTRLLAGIIEKTDAFKNTKTTPRVLEIAALLLESGGDKEKIIRILFTATPFHLLQLWGRASVRSRFDEKLKTLFTFVPKGDFEKTGTETSDLRFVIERMNHYFASPKFHAVFFENPEKNHVRVILKTDTALMKKILEKETGEMQNGILLFKNAFSGFPEAERRVDNIIRGIEE